jgi:hypothetical protein
MKDESIQLTAGAVEFEQVTQRFLFHGANIFLG